MRSLLLIGAVSVQLALLAAPDFKLPPIVATCGQTVVRAEDLNQKWKETLAALPDHCSLEMANRALRQLAEQYIWEKEIRSMLKESGIPVDLETTQRYLLEQVSFLPEAQKEQLKKNNTGAAVSADMQLKAAIHYYLQKTAPDRIRISEAEAELFYRRNQMRFRRPGRLMLGIIETQSREQAESARASLLQGAAFDTVAKRFTPNGATVPTQETLMIIPKLKIREISPVIQSGTTWQIIQIKKREPDSFIPFEEVKQRIIFELAAIKEGAVMGKLLSMRLAQKKIDIKSVLR